MGVGAVIQLPSTTQKGNAMRTNLEIAQGTLSGLIDSRKKDHDNHYVDRDIDTVTACVKAIQAMPEGSVLAKDAFRVVMNIRRIYGMRV
jgi:hypothetical protein